ncbi:hypothetical protein [Brevundimonas lenta]|uniref:Uncharacterized protein n=1 Tax=Brevundimonas lenta TaxID=424796 RepID=A0A7W6JEW9_9CAUL|nr:hypothetical protein [Brevundimonas lenta]MBB4083890.1 hypothetical protein [Brevundimonas lenta]
MLESRLHALTVDLVAMEAVVRALAHAQARKSRTALTDLLECISEEGDRLGAGAAPNDPDVANVRAALDTWVDDIRAAAAVVEPVENAA